MTLRLTYRPTEYQLSNAVAVTVRDALNGTTLTVEL